jgi:hypothetical protein
MASVDIQMRHWRSFEGASFGTGFFLTRFRFGRGFGGALRSRSKSLSRCWSLVSSLIKRNPITLGVQPKAGEAKMVSATDVAAVDQFIANSKRLYGAQPEFGPSAFQRRGIREWQAVWPIADDIGVITTGQLRFIARPMERHSISLLFNEQAVARLDFVTIAECESNPLWAEELGLPARVCGTHFHRWEHNRAHVLATGRWELPCREAVQPQVRRFAQGFPWLASQVNLVLNPDQRYFEPPIELV